MATCACAGTNGCGHPGCPRWWGRRRAGVKHPTDMFIGNVSASSYANTEGKLSPTPWRYVCRADYEYQTERTRGHEEGDGLGLVLCICAKLVLCICAKAWRYLYVLTHVYRRCTWRLYTVCCGNFRPWPRTAFITCSRFSFIIIRPRGCLLFDHLQSSNVC